MAQNPVFIECPEKEWTQVADAVTTGVIEKNKWLVTAEKKAASGIRYWATYRVSDDPAPTGNENEGTFIGEVGALISNTEPIDVYVYCTGDTGSVKVSL